MINYIYILTIYAFCLCLLSCGSSSFKTMNLPSSEDLSAINYLDNYMITSEKYGTETTVEIKDGQRIMKSNALPNHQTGNFPNPGNPNTISAQTVSYTIPVNPKLSGDSKWARQPGVAVNGIKFEPETAERFVCETGEVYRIEAVQDLLDMGLDHNHAHVQPTGAYHYHGVPTELVNALDTGQDLVMVGFALDGFPIYYSKSGKYKASFRLTEELRSGDACSYNRPNQSLDIVIKNSKADGTFVSDWTYDERLGDLDECNGKVIDDQYAYFVTDDYPYMSRCLKGEFKEDRRKGPPPGGHSHRGPRPRGD